MTAVMIGIMIVVMGGGFFGFGLHHGGTDSGHGHGNEVKKQESSVYDRDIHSGGGAEAEKGKVSEDGRKAGEIGNAVCPVSGESIDEKVKVTYEYKGTIYSFCCQGCVDEFKKDPDKYIEKMREKETEGSKQDQSTHKGHHHNH